jgi:class 3 adenylate cyclase
LGGVIGTDIVRYDIFGVDVLIANKMESGGQSGRVQISEATKDLLVENYQNEFKFEENGEIFIAIANKSIRTFFVTLNE